METITCILLVVAALVGGFGVGHWRGERLACGQQQRKMCDSLLGQVLKLSQLVAAKDVVDQASQVDPLASRLFLNRTTPGMAPHPSSLADAVEMGTPPEEPTVVEEQVNTTVLEE